MRPTVALLLTLLPLPACSGSSMGGPPIDSALSYELRRAARLEPLEPRLRLRGMYRYMADAGILTECVTGRRLPVAEEEDNAALQAAYGKARAQPGAELLVQLEGRIALRPKVEGSGAVPTLVVERFLRARPGEHCRRPAVNAH